MPKGPEAEPFYPPGPGRLDEEMVQFKKLGGETIDPNDAKIASAEQRKDLQEALKHYFGTPRLPQVGATTGESDDLVTQLTTLKIRDAEGASPFKTLAQGSKVFRFHCVHCHGLTGDGRGPTGPWVVPHPRDYRPGLFKFVSSKPESPHKPRRDDLTRSSTTASRTRPCRRSRCSTFRTRKASPAIQRTWRPSPATSCT